MIVAIPIGKLRIAARILTRQPRSTMTILAVGDKSFWIETLPPQRVLLASHDILCERVDNERLKDWEPE
jgi:hypothetical protein